MNKKHFTVLVSIILFTTLSTAAVISGGGSSGTGWQKYQDNIDSCDGSCTTSDSFNTQVEENRLQINTGSSGYCGVGGLEKTVTVPEGDSKISFAVKAYQDYWGPNIHGVKIQDEWLVNFDSPGGEAQSWSWELYERDISNYSGQEVKLKVEIGDKSQEWCDMNDHVKEIAVSNISLTSTDVDYYLDDSRDVFQNAVVVYGQYGEVYEDVASNIKQEVNGTLVTDSSGEIPDMKQERDLILVGSPSVNQLTNELAEAGKTRSASQWSNSQDEAMLQLIQNAYSSNQHVLVVAGYSSEELREAESYFEGVLSGENQDQVAGKKLVTITTESAALKGLSLSFNRDLVRPGENIRFELFNGNGEEIDPSGLDYQRTSYRIKHNGEVLGSGNTLDETGLDVPEPSHEEFSGYGTHTLILEYENSNGKVLKAKDSFEVEEAEQNDTEQEFNLKVVAKDESGAREQGVKVTVNGETRETIYSGIQGFQLTPGEYELKAEKEGFETFRQTVEITDHDTRVSFQLRKEDEERNRTGNRMHSLNLHQGWNMISVPEMEYSTPADGFYISDIQDDCRLEEYQGHVAWQYNDGWKHPSAVESAQGVMVYSETGCKAEIDAQKWPVTGDPVKGERQLEKGWNMISVPRKLTLSEIGGDCEFESYDRTPVWHYLGNNEWQRLGMSVNPLRPSRGYYVYASESCQISFDSTEEPPIPTGNFVDSVAGWLK